jgi:hypothetical protein
MYYLKIGNTYHPFLHKSDAEVTQLILLMVIDNKVGDIDILRSQVYDSKDPNLPVKKNLERLRRRRWKNGDA